MNYFIYFLFFYLGISVGSFINVISLRYEPGGGIFNRKIIGGRSRCNHCLKTLGWYDLIPLLSFLWLKARCRYCKRPISFQYPLIEFLTGTLFLAVFFHFLGLNLHAGLYEMISAIIWVFIFSLFILLSIIDFYHLVIPDLINILLSFLGLLLAGSTFFFGKFSQFISPFIGHYAAFFGFRENFWVNHLLGFLIGLAFFGLIIIISKGKGMGWGDFKLVGALGLIFSWPEIIIVMALAFIVGSIFSLPFLIKKKKSLKDSLPFGPFLVVGAATVFFFGYEIMDFYFNFFSLPG